MYKRQEEIKQRDPALARPIPALHEKWLKGPLLRYCVGITDAKFSYELDIDRPIQGSYGLQFIAEARITGGTSHRFCMWTVRRYSLPDLVQCLRNIGWEVVGQFPYGSTESGLSLIHICRAFAFERGLSRRALSRPLSHHATHPPSAFPIAVARNQ